MGHSHHAPTAPAVETLDRSKFGLLPTIFLGAAAVGLIGSFAGFIFNREQFAYSWLFACTFFFTLACGGLFWTLIHHATDAEWSVLVRRQMENLGSVLPIFVLLFLPLLLFKTPSYLWHWWGQAIGVDPEIDEKRGYLNQGFFVARYIGYFVFLGTVILLLRRWSIAQDRDGASRYSHLMRRTAIAGLIIFGVSLTFAAVDWLMGLGANHLWFSTMWGVYIFAGTAGSSMSLLVIIVTVLRSMGYLKPITLEHYHMMGKWMLAFTIFWAYIGFDQYMLIWYANIPEENLYFRIRNTEGWHFFSTLLVVGRFFIPFPILLTQWIKKQPIRLCYLACWVLLMQLTDIYVVVLPALHFKGFSPSILDLTSLLAVGGIAGWYWLRKVGEANLFPTRDPRLSGSLSLTN